MVQMNPQLPMNVTIQNTQSQKAIGNAGLATFRGSEETLKLDQPLKQDVFQSTGQENNSCKLSPEVSGWAAAFSRLSSNQIDQINKSGKLPENMMVSHSPYGGYRLCWKNPITNGCFIGGTQELPPHIEIRKDVFGFACAVPKGYESWQFNKSGD